jgi:V-type H+-transporting ATPase subunit H
MKMVKVDTIPPSPVAAAFKHIQWDPLSSLRLTPQETALLRMAETNPIEYTLGDARDATMYVRVLLKLLAEASVNVSGVVAKITEECNENRALDALDADPLGVVTHYAIAKLNAILTTLTSPWASENGVSIGNVFYAGPEGVLIEQWKALLRVISKGKGDAYAQRHAALCLAQILLAACPSQRSASPKDAAATNRVPSYASAIEPLEALTAWIITQLKSSNAATVGTSVAAMMALMGATEGRQIFAASGGIKYLSRQLRQRENKQSTSQTSVGERKVNSSVQQLYELAFCLWCLTYELNNFADVRADFAKDGLPVMALVELVSSAPREKVVRVALAALRNLATCSADVNPEPDAPRIDSKVFLGEMIACGLMKAIGLLQDRQFTDPDVEADVEALHKLLADNFKEMTRWEVYQNEVETGQLSWGSTHTDAFFKENAKMMEGKDGDFKLVKILISLLGSKDEDIAAIACFDLGEFCRYYPNGRGIAKRLGAKELAMSLIEHDNPELQRHALQCVSKMMVQNWEYVK